MGTTVEVEHHQDEHPTARLDSATHSDTASPPPTVSAGHGPVLASCWDTVGEATVVTQGLSAPSEFVPAGSAADPDRSMAESARRAASTLRRYCVHNGLDRLGDGTYAPDPERFPDSPGHRPTIEDLDQVLADIARFRRDLARALGRPYPLAVVIEHHSDGHLHIHYAFGRYLSKDVVRRCWPHGFVDLVRLQRRGLEKIGRRERCRRTASYLSGYVKKEFQRSHGDPRFHRKRYSTTRHCAPQSRARRFLTVGSAAAWLIEQFGAPPDDVWTSTDPDRPPIVVVSWKDPP